MCHQPPGQIRAADRADAPLRDTRSLGDGDHVPVVEVRPTGRRHPPVLPSERCQRVRRPLHLRNNCVTRPMVQLPHVNVTCARSDYAPTQWPAGERTRSAPSWRPSLRSWRSTRSPRVGAAVRSHVEIASTITRCPATLGPSGSERTGLPDGRPTQVPVDAPAGRSSVVLSRMPPRCGRRSSGSRTPGAAGSSIREP
jgi:hypothetical protein